MKRLIILLVLCGAAATFMALRPLGVVRGYLAGSGWKEYKERGSVCGVELPAERFAVANG